MNLNGQKQQLDMEWIELMKEAKALGLTIEKVRRFLLKPNEDSAS